MPVEKALETALDLASHEEAVVVAAGSLFIAAAVRAIWQSSIDHAKISDRDNGKERRI